MTMAVIRVLITIFLLSSFFSLWYAEKTMFCTKCISYTASWMKMSSRVKFAGMSMAFILMWK